MSDRVLLIAAVVAGITNAVASIARTVWYWEKRRDWKITAELRRQHELRHNDPSMISCSCGARKR